MAPRLKPLKDDKELAAVPLDEPVLVELEPAATGVADEGDEVVPPLNVAEKDGPADKATEREGDGAKLQKQLEASQEAERISRERADKAERDAADARADRDRLRTENVDTEKELLTSSLESAQSEQAAAQAEYEKAFEAGDAKAAGAAQAKIARSAAKIVNLEGAVAQFDQDIKAEKDIPQRAEPQIDIMTAIDRMPNLVPKERAWLKEHPEVLTDPATVRELDVGYHRALKAGHKRGTDSYFQFLDQFLGYEAPERAVDTRSNERASIMAAPVSRDNRSSTTGERTSSTQVRLTPKQREVAALTGVTDTEYARGLQQMEADKQANPERYAQR